MAVATVWTGVGMFNASYHVWGYAWDFEYPTSRVLESVSDEYYREDVRTLC